MKGILIIRKIKEATSYGGYPCRLYASGHMEHDKEEALRYTATISKDEKWKQEEVDIEI